MTGLDSATTSALRRECFQNEIKLQVVKNTLFEKALEKVGGDFAALQTALKGNTGIMFCQTANAPAKLIKKFAKGHNDMPGLKAAYQRKAFTLVQTSSMHFVLSRARTNSLQRLFPLSKVQSTASFQVSMVVQLFMGCLMQSKKKTLN